MIQAMPPWHSRSGWREFQVIYGDSTLALTVKLDGLDLAQEILAAVQ